MTRKVEVGRGETVRIAIGGITITIDSPQVKFSPGDTVLDREQDDEEELIVVKQSNRPIRDIPIDDGSETVADVNPEYDEYDDAVFCVYKDGLLRKLSSVPDNIEDFMKTGKFAIEDVDAYAFPSKRLKPPYNNVSEWPFGGGGIDIIEDT